MVRALACVAVACVMGVALSAERACAEAGPTSTPEVRGVWVNYYAITPDRAAGTLRSVVDAKCNAVFLRAPTIHNRYGDNHGKSDAQQFAAFVDAATARGLAVHAWITNKMRAGDTQVDFTDANERAAQAQWAVDLLTRYPKLAGVHLDYIRYSEWGNPDAAKMGAVTATVRAIREAIRKEHPGKMLTAAVFTADPSYVGGTWGGVTKWEGDLPQWYRAWHARDAHNHYVTEPKARHDDGRFKDYDPVHLYGPVFFHMQQDPVMWIVDDLVDGVFVMQYTSNRPRFEAEVLAWRAMLGERADRVWMGLGWLTEDGQPDWRRDAAALAHHIAYGRAHGVTGYCVFTLGVEGIDDGPVVETLAKLNGE
ncbi:MAG: hypothetical protein GC159_01020 [Phycisphaera sp.]|nr:hypothetical protein [Phycisphaera sp.]